MHRIHFNIATVSQWYLVIHEAKALYGNNWRAQPRVKRRLEHSKVFSTTINPIWFDVPDPVFATWITVKHSIICSKITHK